MLKRVISLLILFAVLSLASCSAATDTNDTTVTTAPSLHGDNESETPEITARLVPDIPEGTKYGGYQFVIANSFYSETKYTTNAIDPGYMSGDVLNDAIYSRTLKVEDVLEIDVVDRAYTVEEMTIEINAGDVTFDLMTVNLSNVRRFINLGAVVDFYELEGIDLSMPWWDQNAQQKLSVDGKLFYTLSDFLITGIDNARAVYFNKRLHADLGLEDLYEMSKNGTWTLDEMRRMGLMAVSDLNGDGKFTREDRFGMLCWNATSFYEAYLTSSDAEIMKQSETGIPYFYCFEERFIDVYTRLLDVFSKDNMTYLENDLNLFMEGHSLFTTWTLYGATRLRAMDTDFGIIPLPKYDLNQESYWHVSPNPHAMMVPIAVKDRLRTGIILEALSYYSSEHFSDSAVIPTYFELAVKGKTTRDAESREMLDIIKNSISYIIKLDDTGMTSSIYSAFGTNNYNIASLLKKQEKVAKAQLEKIFAAMGVSVGG